APGATGGALELERRPKRRGRERTAAAPGAGAATSARGRARLVDLLPVPVRERVGVGDLVHVDEGEVGRRQALVETRVEGELTRVARGLLARAAVERAEGTVLLLDDAAEETHGPARVAPVVVL